MQLEYRGNKIDYYAWDRDSLLSVLKKIAPGQKVAIKDTNFTFTASGAMDELFRYKRKDCLAAFTIKEKIIKDVGKSAKKLWSVK